MVLLRDHALGMKEPLGGTTHYQQMCTSCEGIRRVKGRDVQWLDRDGTVLPDEVKLHLEKSCPGPIEQPTLRQHYRV
jgi:hypothetical protein